MKLLQQLMEMAVHKMKRKKKGQKEPDAQRNFVAKHAHQKSGAGQHEDKQGQKAKRSRQKRQWHKEEGM